MLNCGTNIVAREEGTCGLILQSEGKLYGTFSKHVITGNQDKVPSKRKIFQDGSLVAEFRKGDRSYVDKRDLVWAEILPKVICCNVPSDKIGNISQACASDGNKQVCRPDALTGIVTPGVGMTVELSTSRSLVRGEIIKVLPGSGDIKGERCPVLIRCLGHQRPLHGDSGAIWYDVETRQAVANLYRILEDGSSDFVCGNIVEAMKSLVISDWKLF